MMISDILEEHGETVLDTGITLKDAFKKDPGHPSFDAAVIFTITASMVVAGATKVVKMSIADEEAIARDFERLLKFSSIPNHPVHKLKKSIEEKLADYQKELDDLRGRPVQRKVEWAQGKVWDFTQHARKKLAAGAG